MKDKTYIEWQELGYHVRKGERSTGRNKSGEAIFTRKQVEESNEREYEDEIFDAHDCIDPREFEADR